ncbi:uncharacterized protein LOC144436229 isoform X2 [Glandiceps talaboti]
MSVNLRRGIFLLACICLNSSLSVSRSLSEDGKDFETDRNAADEHEMESDDVFARRGLVIGDPHITTLDGLVYDVEGRPGCSYYILKDCRGVEPVSFEVTAEFKGRSEIDKSRSFICAVKIVVDGQHTVELKDDASMESLWAKSADYSVTMTMTSKTNSVNQTRLW